MLCHGLLYVGKGNLALHPGTDRAERAGFMEGLQHLQRAKVDMIRTASCGNGGTMMRSGVSDVRVDPKKLRTDLKSRKPGFNNICVHKGLAPGPPDPLRGHPGDLPKAARDWPKLNFISYHACIQPKLFPGDTLKDIQSRAICAEACPTSAGRPNMRQLVKDLPNLLRGDWHRPGRRPW
jgi:hypothetical protein